MTITLNFCPLLILVCEGPASGLFVLRVELLDASNPTSTERAPGLYALENSHQTRGEQRHRAAMSRASMCNVDVAHDG